jgi:hypothetical protein
MIRRLGGAIRAGLQGDPPRMEYIDFTAKVT